MEPPTSQDNNVFKIIKGPNDQLDIHLIKSANAWWMDIDKVISLIEAFRFDCTISEACTNAGITIKQYKYFAKLHPVIRSYKKFYSDMNVVRARRTVSKHIGKDFYAALRFLKRKRPEEFKPPETPKRDISGEIVYYYKGKNNPIDPKDLNL